MRKQSVIGKVFSTVQYGFPSRTSHVRVSKGNKFAGKSSNNFKFTAFIKDFEGKKIRLTIEELKEAKKK